MRPWGRCSPLRRSVPAHRNSRLGANLFWCSIELTPSAGSALYFSLRAIVPSFFKYLALDVPGLIAMTTAMPVDGLFIGNCVGARSDVLDHCRGFVRIQESPQHPWTMPIPRSKAEARVPPLQHATPMRGGTAS